MRMEKLSRVFIFVMFRFFLKFYEIFGVFRTIAKINMDLDTYLDFVLKYILKTNNLSAYFKY